MFGEWLQVPIDCAAGVELAFHGSYMYLLVVLEWPAVFPHQMSNVIRALWMEMGACSRSFGMQDSTVGGHKEHLVCVCVWFLQHVCMYVRTWLCIWHTVLFYWLLLLFVCVYGVCRYINANGLEQNVSLLAIVRDLKVTSLVQRLLLHGVSRVSSRQWLT